MSKYIAVIGLFLCCSYSSAMYQVPTNYENIAKYICKQEIIYKLQLIDMVRRSKKLSWEKTAVAIKS